MSQAKSERLMNLVIALLVARTPVPRARLREIVPGYARSSDEAFERMFERDKDELREIGIPIEAATDPFGEDTGYLVRRSEFELPPVHLEPDEAAVLGLAARVWQQSGLARATSSALLKLRAAGVEVDTSALAGLEPSVGMEDPAFEPLWRAVLRRQRVRFAYRKPEDEVAARRTVEPWALLSWHGRWYLLGHDVGRAASRLFRLSRIEGDVRTTGLPGAYVVPPDATAHARAVVGDSGPPAPVASEPVVLRLRRGRGSWLRRRARVDRPDPGHDGFDVVELDVPDALDLAGEVVACGPDAVALHPPGLRAEVVRRLQVLAGAVPVGAAR